MAKQWLLNIRGFKMAKLHLWFLSIAVTFFAGTAFAQTYKYTLKYGVSPCKINPGVSVFCDNAIYTPWELEATLGKPAFQSKVIKAEILSKPYSFYLSSLIQKEKHGTGYFAFVAIQDADWGTQLGSTVVFAETVEQLNRFKVSSNLVKVSETEAYILHVWFEPKK
jgi:hypothetical protein